MRGTKIVGGWLLALVSAAALLLNGCSAPIKEEKATAKDAGPTAPVEEKPVARECTKTTARPADVVVQRAFLPGELTAPQRQLDVDATPPGSTFSDDFLSVEESAARWLVTKKHDFAELLVGVVADGTGKGGRLRLGCATRGTDDRTVKRLGLVSRQRFPLAEAEFCCDFDWNEQANGCYLTASVILCPSMTRENPEDEAQWFKFEYVGVPPGKNARAAVWLKDGSRLRCAYDEGWPKEQRTGRKIGKQHIQLKLKDGGWEVHENSKLLCASGNDSKLPFKDACLYLQMTSHSNYPRREVYFDNVKVKCSLPKQAKGTKDDQRF